MYRSESVGSRAISNAAIDSAVRLDSSARATALADPLEPLDSPEERTRPRRGALLARRSSRSSA